MLFNSLEFFVFLIAVFGLYWLPVRKDWWQNAVVVGASLFFYAYWDWRVLGLFVGSIAFTMFVARRLTKPRLIASIAVLLAILGVFKYYNFFIDSLSTVVHSTSTFHLNLILPLGISFYTFMCISYLVDSYQSKLQPTTYSLLSTFSYLSFFPQIIAGPIGRGPQMLPQFSAPRRFRYEQGMEGVRLIIYGLFKKMVVADLLAMYVEFAFKNAELYSSVTCFIGMIFYTLQIYCDFSGYSDCAIGVGKLFGIELMVNFNRPYLSKTFSDFWRNWHISLSTWFRDYVYIPLGGSRCILPRVILNTWIVFLLSGLWHGAAWTFVFWGGLHALYLTLGILKKRYLPPLNTYHLSFITPMKTLIVFMGAAFAWIFFRAGTWDAAMTYVKCLFACNFKTTLMALCAGQGPVYFAFAIAACALLALGEFTSRKWPVILVLLAAIVFMGLPSGGEFIYAQF